MCVLFFCICVSVGVRVYVWGSMCVGTWLFRFFLNMFTYVSTRKHVLASPRRNEGKCLKSCDRFQPSSSRQVLPGGQQVHWTTRHKEKTHITHLPYIPFLSDSFYFTLLIFFLTSGRFILFLFHITLSSPSLFLPLSLPLSLSIFQVVSIFFFGRSLYWTRENHGISILQIPNCFVRAAMFDNWIVFSL